jgi:hypothetical protein
MHVEDKMKASLKPVAYMSKALPVMRMKASKGWLADEPVVYLMERTSAQEKEVEAHLHTIACSRVPAM